MLGSWTLFYVMHLGIWGFILNYVYLYSLYWNIVFLCTLLISSFLTLILIFKHWISPLIPILCSSFEVCIIFFSYQIRPYPNFFLPLVDFPCIFPFMALCNKFPLLNTCLTHVFFLSLFLATRLLTSSACCSNLWLIILSVHFMCSIFLKIHISNISSLWMLTFFKAHVSAP